MSDTPSSRSSIGSLIASRRQRRQDGPTPQARPRPETGRLVRFARTGATVLEGHVFDPAEPDRRFVVELLLDGLPLALARAELFVPDLFGLGGDGCHGFAFSLDPAALPALSQASARVANTLEPVGEALDLQAPGGFAASAAPLGGVEWPGGLRLAGWARREAFAFPPLIEAFADGARIAGARADRWRSVAFGARETPEPSFELTLPRELADGRPHRIDILCEGRALPGSPVTVIAFADPLREHLFGRAETEAESEALRGALFDESFPDAVPFAAFAEWDRRFPLAAPERKPAGPAALAVIGEAGAEETLSGPGLDIAGGWIGAVLPSGSGPTRFAPADLLRFLGTEAEQCPFLVLIPAGARLRPAGLDRLLAALEADPAAVIAYGDLAFAGEDGEPQLLALPAFDYERALEQGLGAGLFAIRRAAALEAARQGIDELHRLFLFPLDRSGPRGRAHLHVPGCGFVLPAPTPVVAEALAAAARDHLAARGLAAEVTVRPDAMLPAVRVRRAAPAASLGLILDPGSDAGRVPPALEALEATRKRHGLAVFVAATGLDAALRERLRLDGVETVESDASASPARRLGRAVEAAGSELVCLFDARLRPDDPDWLEELLSRLAEGDCGAVAPRIVAASGLVAEAGRVLRPAGAPVPAFADRRQGDPGYGDALLVARQTAAAGPACLLTRRADFLALGGFDPVLFPDHLGAEDYCLKLQALGRRVVVTPDAVLRRAPGADPAPRPASLAREARLLAARWAGVVAGDPFYSPLLDRGPVPFAGLAWPPGDRAPRRPDMPQARFLPPGW